REELAADLGPGQTGGYAHQIGLLPLAEAEAADARELLDVLGGDREMLALLHGDLLDRLAREVRDLALEIPDAGFARVVADQLSERILRDRPLALPQAVLLDLLRDQVAACDLDLLVLGIAG